MAETKEDALSDDAPVVEPTAEQQASDDMPHKETTEADQKPTEPTDNTEQDLATELEASRARADENWDKLLRMQAEMDNLRKRNLREIENAHKFALEKIATELLGIRDSLENGIAASRAEDVEIEQLREGSELILKQMTQTMEKFNIAVINPEGEKFNPDMHQAMSTQEHPEMTSNTVITVLQKGYTLNERLLRPALVMVSK